MAQMFSVDSFIGWLNCFLFMAVKDLYQLRASNVPEDSCQKRQFLFSEVSMNREIPMVLLAIIHPGFVYIPLA